MKSAVMEGLAVDYIKSIVDSLTAHGAVASVSEDDSGVIVLGSKRVPALRVTRGMHQGKLTDGLVFTFLEHEKGVTPFLRSSANLKDLVHDVNLIMQNFPELFVQKVARRRPK